MDKLYPPQIEGILPAFYGKKNNKNKTEYVLQIPYAMNKTVGANLVSGMAIRIKTVQSNQLVYTGKIDVDLNDKNDVVKFNIIQGQLGFQNSHSKFQIGQYYKVQIAYVQNEQVGYYSTVGVIKCTGEPQVTIANMVEGGTHLHTIFYTGVYSNSNDITEKLYSYYFNIYDNLNNLFFTSGELLHNTEEDVTFDESKDEFQLIKTLEDNKIYTIVYGGTTINGLRVESAPYKIIQQSIIPPEIDAELLVEMNYNNGYVKVNLKGRIDKDTDLEAKGLGTFQILRATETDFYTDWQPVYYFTLLNSPPSSVEFKDFTVEQGKKYKYALQQYNKESGLVSSKLLSNEVMVDFEDCFLYDGEKQLKIKYNPKVSSFKEVLLEAKTNTLGGQYPFIFRNGKVAYKEFPLSGLISYLMDDENLFLKDEDMGLENLTHNYCRQATLKSGITTSNTDYFEKIRQETDYFKAEQLYNAYLVKEQPDSKEKQIEAEKTRTTSLLDYNQIAERIFKLKVLEFLNDGKPKLFRSASEGNYIVRLMNSSLTPNDQLGRMLHTFSTTAVEIKEFSLQSLYELELIKTQNMDTIETKQLSWETVLLENFIDDTQEENEEWIKLNRKTIVSFQCLDMIPGTKIQILFEDEAIPVEIQIGVTGSYYSNLENNISEFRVHKDVFKVSKCGQVTFGFYEKAFNHFDTYEKIEIKDIPLMQIIGEERSDDYKLLGIKERLEDIKNKLIHFNLLHFVKREVIPVYKFTSVTNGEQVTDYYITSNLEYADVDYSNFTTNISLDKWTNPNDDDRLEPISIEYQENGQPANTPGNSWLNNAPIEVRNKEGWYSYNFGDRVITSLRCTIPQEQSVEPLWLYFKTNLNNDTGSFVKIKPEDNIVFIYDSGDSQIIDLKVFLPALQNTRLRKGYLSYETYLSFENLEEYQKVFKDSKKLEQFDPLVIYKIVNSTIGDSEIYLDKNIDRFVEYSNNIKINDSYVDITQIEEYQVSIPDTIDDIYVPSGVIADIGFQSRVITYGIENNKSYSDLWKTKQLWLKIKLLLAYIIYGEEMYPIYPTSHYPQDYSNLSFKNAAIKINKELELNILDSKGELLEEQPYSTVLKQYTIKEKEAYIDYIDKLNKELAGLALEV